MKLNEVLIVPTKIIMEIAAIAIETGNKDLLLLTQMCRVNPNLPQEVVNNAFEAGKESIDYSEMEGFSSSQTSEEYIKNLEL